MERRRLVPRRGHDEPVDLAREQGLEAVFLAGFILVRADEETVGFGFFHATEIEVREGERIGLTRRIEETRDDRALECERLRFAVHGEQLVDVMFDAAKVARIEIRANGARRIAACVGHVAFERESIARGR